QRRDSIADSSAIEMAGPARFCAPDHSNSGRAGIGRPCGIDPKRLPMVSTGTPKTDVATTPSTRAAMVPGARDIQRNQAGSPVPVDFGHHATRPSETRPTMTAGQWTVSIAPAKVLIIEKKLAGISAT